jgi:hypothetical protein
MEEDDPVDKLSAEYIDLRNQRERLKQDFSSKDKVFEDRMTEIENSLVDTLTKTGLSSMSTANATIIKRVVSNYNPSNWEAIYQMVDRHKAFGLFFKRLNNANMKQFLSDHPDEYPAGLNVDSRYTVTVKRKSSTE